MLCSTIVSAKPINKELHKIDNLIKEVTYYDQLDQYQENYTFDENQSYSRFNIYYKNESDYRWCAQSFKPSLPVLTRVNLFLYKNCIDCVLILSLSNVF